MLENGLRFYKTFRGPKVEPVTPAYVTEEECRRFNKRARITPLTTDVKLNTTLVETATMDTSWLDVTGLPESEDYIDVFVPAAVNNGTSNTTRDGEFRSLF